jgi:hypothetical protein
MDLITTSSFSLFLVSTIGVLLAFWMENPTIQSILNTTSVVLKNTEVVWRPAVNVALSVLKPLMPLVLLVGKTVVKAVILAMQMMTTAFVAFSEFTQSLGLNITQTGRMVLYGAKDLLSSLYTVTKALAFLIANTLSGISYVIDSFEMVGIFMRKVLFESHSVTWQDVMDIALPFAIVGILMTFVMYRAYAKFVKSEGSSKDAEYVCIPRRSSRIARKRALLLCTDASDATLAREKASAKAANL